MLSYLNKKPYVKFCHKEENYLHTFKNAKNFLILKGNYIWTLSVSFLDISDRKKILNFSGKNAETHISENKTQVGH